MILPLEIMACHRFGALVIGCVSLLKSTIVLAVNWSFAVFAKRCSLILVVVIVLIILPDTICYIYGNIVLNNG